MMRIVSILLVLMPFSLVAAEEAGTTNPAQQERKTPPIAEEYHAMILAQVEELKKERENAPTTLAEAHARLEQMLSAEELAEIDAMPSEDDMIQYHFSLVLNIRNGWGLWKGGPLAQHMRELGFTHPDNMSGVILDTFWCKRHGKDFRLEERAAECLAYMEAQKEAQAKEEERVRKAKAAMRNMMMGLSFEKRDVPVVRMPDRGRYSSRARFLSRFRDGIFLTNYSFPLVRRGAFVTRGNYFDPADQKIHRIRVEEVNDVHSAVVIGDEAWFVGTTDDKAVLLGVGAEDRAVVPLPLDDEVPQLGCDGLSLLAVYPQRIYRLTDCTWELIYSGGVLLPRSGLPPQRYGNMILFRDEGSGENRKRLWWLTLGEQPQLTALDDDTGLVGPEGPRWENSFSYCMTKAGVLWACVGESYARKSLLRRSADGSYSIAIMNNSVRFAESLFGSKEADQGLSVSAVAALPDGTLLLVGDAGLDRLKGNDLIQELAFAPRGRNGKPVGRGNWSPNTVIALDDGSYCIGSGSWDGIYLLRQGDDGQWTVQSPGRGDPVVW